MVADSRIKADLDMVDLKYGPLIYNVEMADNGNIDRKPGDGPLRTEWRPDLLGGVMVISGKWEDGALMLAIPNFARANRGGPHHDYPSDDDVAHAIRSKPLIESKVWTYLQAKSLRNCSVSCL